MIFNTTLYSNVDNEHYYDCECSDCLGRERTSKITKLFNIIFFRNQHWYDCECEECLRNERLSKITKYLIVIMLCGAFFYLGFLCHDKLIQKRPFTVNERQTWFRENGYLDVNEPKNFDGKCGELLHKAEKDAMFWNYEKK